MKLVRENINFTQDSDPIKDMEIGRISFFEKYLKIYKTPANKLYKDWINFLHQFTGKTIYGKMMEYEIGKYEPNIKKIKIRIHRIHSMDETGRVKIEISDNDYDNLYFLIESEKYVISDE